jgi:hypothetical protein
VIIFDIETDGLIPTKIHVLSVYSDGVFESFTSYDEMRSYLLSRPDSILVGHNIIRYDIPAIEKILGIKIKNTLMDTLSLSWYLYPHRTRHGLEHWGDDLGVKKVEVKDWKGLPIKAYIERCEGDVKINSLLYEKQWKDLVELYGSEEKAMSLVKYLQFKMKCAAEQERVGWKLDVKKAKDGLEELSSIKEEKVEQLKRAMPRVPTVKKKSRPKKPFRKDGSLSAVGEKWFALLRERSLPEDYIGVVEVVDGYEEPNPNSHDQIKDWLYSAGWKPETLKHVRNKKTGDVKKIPQVNLPNSGGICPSVQKLYGKEPAFEILEGLSVVSHRITILKGFLKEVNDDGYIKAEVQGLTNTLRFKHAVCVNLPGVDRPYGSLIRGCLTAPEGYELCGSDMCGLEDRTKQHWMWKHDPGYVREMMSDDFDPHLDLAVVAGALTPEQAQAHKDGTEDHGRVRKIYKAVNYAAVYGAGVATLARSAGVSQKEAKDLLEAYWKRNWSVRAIPKDITVKKSFGGSMWLLNPVSNLWYSLRYEKDIFSTLNQGTGVYCFDTWIAFIFNRRPQLTAQFHDEIVLTVKKGYRKNCTLLLKWAIRETNKKLKLNRELDVDVQFGNTYSEIH